MKFNSKPKLKLKTPAPDLPFKQLIFKKIIASIQGDYNNNNDVCVLWSGYKQNYKRYNKACYIVYMKDGRKHFIEPQKYIFNYLHNPEATYGELIRIKNTVRNIDHCKHRGLCCTLSHLEVGL